MSEDRKLLISEVVLTDEQLKAVGCLAIESTRLETHVEQAIIDHCGTILGEFLVKDKMLGGKVDLFRAVFTREALDENHARALEQLFGELKSDIAKRNTVIHGSWEERMSLAQLAKMQDRDAAVYKKKMTMKASEVMDLARQFANYQNRLIDWYMQVAEYYDAKRIERGEPLE